MGIYIGERYVVLVNAVGRPTTGWRAEDAQLTMDGDVLLMTPTGSSYPKGEYDSDLIQGHIYYFRVSAWTGARGYEETRVQLADATGSFWDNVLDFTTVGDWQTLSKRFALTRANATRIVFAVACSNTGAASYAGATKWRGLMAIDLTAAFGVGNEPNVEWCDANIPDFYGTQSILIPGSESVARKVRKVYIGDTNGVARKVRKVYIGDTNGVARLTYTTGGSYTVASEGTYGFSVVSQPPNPNPSELDGVYRSDNYHIASSRAVARIEFEGYDVFTIYIRSYADRLGDFMMVSVLDAASAPVNYLASTVKAHTHGNSQSGTSLSSYTKVQYPTDGGKHHIYIVYRKDGSTNQGDDRGYFLVER